MPTTSTTVTVRLRGEVVPVSLTEHQPDGGAPDPGAPAVLVLHGGAGPQSVDAFALRLAAHWRTRVLVPTHPGFAGTPRHDAVGSIRDLAALYGALLDDEEDAAGVPRRVVVLGSSIGGWIAAELAALAPDHVAALVLLDAVGLEVAEHPVADFFALTLDEVAELSYADPDRFRIDPDALPPAARAAMDAGRAALRDYGGTAMVDPTLHDRLPQIAAPTLVVWGEADRIVDAAVGRAYAQAVPGARFVLLPGAGHLPQLEAPEPLLEVLDAFVPTGYPAG